MEIDHKHTYSFCMKTFFMLTITNRMMMKNLEVISKKLY